MTIRTARIEDLPAVVKCHKAAFPDALSSKQGNAFISKMLEWYIVSERGLLFHVEDGEGNIQGYCGGIITLEPGLTGAASSISQYAFNTFVWSYIKRPWLFLHPENFKRIPFILRNIAYKVGLMKQRKSPTAATPEPFVPFMGLVVIGVNPASHGKGYGSALLQEFEERARRHEGVKRIQLSVKSNNDKALRSYLRNGWVVKSEDELIKYLIKNL